MSTKYTITQQQDISVCTSKDMKTNLGEVVLVDKYLTKSLSPSPSGGHHFSVNIVSIDWFFKRIIGIIKNISKIKNEQPIIIFKDKIKTVG